MCHSSLSVWFIIFVISDIFWSVWKCFFTISIFIIIYEFSNISCPICICVGSLSVEFIIFVFTDIFFTFWRYKSYLSVWFIIFEFSNSFISIGKSVNSLTAVFAIFKFTNIFISFFRNKSSFINSSFKNISSNNRVISGDVLNGKEIDNNSSLNYHDEILSIIKTDNNKEFLGWLKQGINKYSLINNFLSKIFSNKKSIL